MLIRHKQHALIIAATLSIATSLSMVIVASGGSALPLLPLMMLNWALFMAVTWLVGWQISLFRRGDKISPTHHNIWRTVILAFVGCGLIVITSAPIA